MKLTRFITALAGVVAFALMAGSGVSGALGAGLAPVPTATQINGVVWVDANADGVNDASEPGLAGASVTLFNAASTQVGVAFVTPASGVYSFTGLAPGDGPFRVQVSLPNPYLITTGGASNDVTVVTPAVGEATGVAAGTQIDAAAKPAWVATLGRVGAPGYFSGTGPFDVVCPQAGRDCSSTDSVVRSQDSLTFNWSASFSNTASGTWPANLADGVFEQTLVPSALANIGAIALPAECNGAAPPSSRVTFNADRSVTIVCNLGVFTTGSARLLQIIVPVTGANNSTVTSTARTYGTGVEANGGNATAPPTTILTAIPSPTVIDPFTITAGFAFDSVAAIRAGSTAGATYIDLDGNAATPNVRGTVFNAEVGIFSRRKGQEPIQGPVVVGFDLFATTGGQTAPFTGTPISWYPLYNRCILGANEPNNQAMPAHSGTVGPSTVSGRNQTCTPTRINPADATSGLNLTINGITIDGPFPTQSSGSGFFPAFPLPADIFFVGTYIIPIFVPYSELDRLDGVPGNGLVGPNSYLDVRVTNFDPVSVTGTTNNDGAGTKEPGYCSSTVNPYSVADVTSASHCQDAIPFVGQQDFPGLSRNYDNIFVNPIPARATTNFQAGKVIVGATTGAAVVGPNAVYTVSQTHIIQSEFGFRDMRQCDVFDNQTQRLSGLANMNTANGLGVPNKDFGNANSDYTIRYGHFDFAINQMTGPIMPNGRFPGAWDAMRLVKNSCANTPPLGGWHTDPTQVPGGIDAVNAVFVTRTDPNKLYVSDGGFAGAATTDVRFNLQARSTFNGGLYAGQIIPTGTVLADMAYFQTTREDGAVIPLNSQWGPSNPGSTSEINQDPGGLGGRVTMGRAVASVFIRTVTIDGVGTAPAAVNVNGSGSLGLPVVWEVLPGLNSLTGQVETIPPVDMAFDIPAGLTYDPSCSAQLGGIAPSRVFINFPSAGRTRVAWDLPALVSGQPALTDYRVCTQSSALAASGSTYTSQAYVEAFQYTLSNTSDAHLVQLFSSAQLEIVKTVDATLAVPNSVQVYTLGARNRSATFTFSDVQFIDVLPYIGDGTNNVGADRDPVSDYGGTVGLASVPTATYPNTAGSPTAPVTYAYTADPPATVSQNPNIVTNTWCSYNGVSFTVVTGAGVCPTSLATVTAFRTMLNAPLAVSSSTSSTMVVQVRVNASGNRAGDVYANRFVASSSDLTIPITGALVALFSNQTTVRVVQFAVGDLVFRDVNQDGRYTAGTDSFVPDGVRVELWSPGADAVVGGVDDVLLDFTTTVAGKYVFRELNPGRVYVRIPSSQFAVGGLLNDWLPTSPQGLEDQNQGVSQDGVVGPGGLATSGVVSRVHTLAYTTSGLFLLGQEPRLDNTFSLPFGVVGDDFTNVTIDIGLLAAPSISLVKEVCDPGAGSCAPAAALGADGWNDVSYAAAFLENITWRLTATNTGGQTLTNLVVTDPSVAACATPTAFIPPASLAPGASFSYTCQTLGVVIGFTNTATVEGTNPNNVVVTDDDPATVTLPDANAGIQIVKYVIDELNGPDGADANTAPGIYVPVDDTVTWRYVVTIPAGNNVPMRNVSVVDNGGPNSDFNPEYVSGDINSNDILEVGETWLYVSPASANLDVTPGQYTNVATVEGTAVSQLVALVLVDTDPANHFGADPQIGLVKSTNGEDANLPPGPLVTVGAAVTWTFAVTNEGNVALSDVTVTDDRVSASAINCGGGTNVIRLLLPDQKVTCTATGVATLGFYANIGTVVGTPTDSNGVRLRDSDDVAFPTVTATDPSHYFGVPPILAFTGMSLNTLAVGLGALALLVLGLIAVAVARRRRPLEAE